MSIRTATAQDIAHILAIYAPYVENTTISFEYTTPTLEEFTQRFHTVTAQFPWLVWEENGQILGYAYASAPFQRAAYRWCASSSVYLRPDAQHRGIGRALCQALEAALQKQGYRKLYAVITSGNQASLDFHKSLGYRLLTEFPGCGIKFGKLLGVYWFEKDLSCGDLPEQPPVPFSELL